MANKERLLALADYIESGEATLFGYPVSMDMGTWASIQAKWDEPARNADWSAPICGAAACIAGHCRIQSDPNLSVNLAPVMGAFNKGVVSLGETSEFRQQMHSSMGWAAEYLDLDEGDARRLFIPEIYLYGEGDEDDGEPIYLGTHNVTKALAVEVLRLFAETGSIEWVQALSNVGPEGLSH